MAKDKKEKKAKAPKGTKCFQKLGGGSHRFKNRIIKPNQIFCINPDAIPDGVKDVFKEVPYIPGCVVVETDIPVAIKEKKEPVVTAYTTEKAKDEEGNELKEGRKFLYNVVAEDGKVVSENPLLKKEAEALAEAMNS